jgi:hypothetical protein
MALRHEAGIGRRQKIGAGIGQCAIQIKNNRSHIVTFREPGRACSPHNPG